MVWFFKIRPNRTFSFWPKILPKCIFGRPLNSLFYVNPIAEVAIGKLSESAETDLPSFTQLLHSENQNEGGGKMQRHWLLISIIGKRPSFCGCENAGVLVWFVVSACHKSGVAINNESMAFLIFHNLMTALGPSVNKIYNLRKYTLTVRYIVWQFCSKFFKDKKKSGSCKCVGIFSRA